MRPLHPNPTLTVTTGIPEAACVLVLRDRAGGQGGLLALHGEHAFWPHGLPDSTSYYTAADFKGKMQMPRMPESKDLIGALFNLLTPGCKTP